MAKRSKQTSNDSSKKAARDAAQPAAGESSPYVFPARPPRKNRLLLTISIVIVVLWLLFLLYSALIGPP